MARKFCDACVGIEKVLLSICYFLFSLLICTGEFILFLLLFDIIVIFILELQSPLNSGPFYCLMVLDLSEHADFPPVSDKCRK